MFKKWLLVLALAIVIINISCKKNPTAHENTVPTASFIISPTSGTTETTFNFDAGSSTDEEDETSVLLVRWDWENDGVWDTDYRTIKTITHKFSLSGTHTIILEVKDTGDLTSTVTDTVNVSIANTAPTASFTVDPTIGTTATFFTFDASGSTDNEDATSVLQVRWDWENDGTYDTNYSTTKTASHRYTSEGTYAVKLEVMDPNGLTSFTTMTVSVSNTAPTASFTIDPISGTTATIFTFNATGSTDDHDETSALQVRWDWTNDGTFDTNYTTNKTATHQYSTSGIYTIKLEVMDSGGLTNTITKNVSLANTAPTASFTVTPASGTTATTFWFDGSGSSDNEDPNSALQFRWDWEEDGTWDTAWSSSDDATHQYSSAGTYVVKMEVKDSEGLTNTDTKTVIVANTEPIASFTVNPSTGTVSTVFNFDASGSSDNEDPNSALQFRWDWEEDGTWDTAWSSSDDATHQYSSAGTYVVKMEVKDSEGWVDTAWRTVIVSSVNTAPTASFTVTPASGTTATTFWFDASGSSDNEDPNSALQFRWDWEEDGTWDTAWSSSDDGTHQYSSAGTYVVKMEVKDSEGWVDTAWRTVIVSSGGNTAPTASFTVTPASGTTATTFWFDGSGSSDNEDPNSALQFRWDWEEDGTWDTAWSSSDDATHQYSSAGTYVVKMEVKDSEGWVDTAWRTVIVSSGGNTAPTASFTVTLASGAPATTFYFDASGSSDNEDPNSALQFRWDWEEDGVWDTAWSSSDDATHQYSTAGTYVVKMEVKDSEGWVDTAWRTVIF